MVVRQLDWGEVESNSCSVLQTPVRMVFSLQMMISIPWKISLGREMVIFSSLPHILFQRVPYLLGVAFYVVFWPEESGRKSPSPWVEIHSFHGNLTDSSQWLYQSHLVSFMAEQGLVAVILLCRLNILTPSLTQQVDPFMHSCWMCDKYDTIS